MKLTHGAIACGVVASPDLDAALGDYQGRLGLTLLEQGTVPAGLATGWVAPAVAGARMATARRYRGLALRDAEGR